MDKLSHGASTSAAQFDIIEAVRITVHNYHDAVTNQEFIASKEIHDYLEDFSVSTC